MISQIEQLLAEKLGSENVTRDPTILAEYRSDMTENEAGNPQMMVYPLSVEHVQIILREANRAAIPVVAVMANTNLGGLSIAVRGGILVNFQKMNRILEVNPDDRYMVVEPGVTWQQIRDYLKHHHPALRFAYPLSPPDTGVVQNCLMDGLANLLQKI